jgi:hypothetical protein
MHRASPDLEQPMTVVNLWAQRRTYPLDRSVYLFGGARPLDAPTVLLGRSAPFRAGCHHGTWGSSSANLSPAAASLVGIGAVHFHCAIVSGSMGSLRKREGRLQDAALDAVGQRHGVEVDQQADMACTEAKVRQELGFVQRQDALDRLEFQNHLIVHDDVGDVAAVEQDFVVTHGERYLATERYGGAVDLVAETQFVYGLEPTRTEATMHPHREADDRVREVAAVREAGLQGQ